MAPVVERVSLAVESRTGDSTWGYSFAGSGLLVPSEADLHLNAWDCGARGRWVTLNAAEGLQLCVASGVCGPSLSVGGSDPAFEGEAEVRKGDVALGSVKVVEHSPTPMRWYEANPMPAYVVTLEVRRGR